MTSAELIEDVAGLERWRDHWDHLAVSLGAPYCAPAWMLAWWAHAVSGTAKLRTVVVHNDGELVGLAPYFVQVGRAGLAEYRILGAGSAHRIGPLAKGGYESEVAVAIAKTLATARPRPSSFLLEGVDGASHWPALIRGAWPGPLRPRQRIGYRLPAPTLSLKQGETYDQWFASRSSNFRGQMRRKGRQLTARSGQIRLAQSTQEMKRDLDAMVRLHHLRWAARGGSGALNAGVEAALRQAASQLGPERFRLWTIDVDNEPVCVQLFVVAGGELAYWGGGFDPEWEDFQPAQLTILDAVKDAFARGERRIDFGGGDQRYKWRFADSDEPVSWVSVFPRNRRYLLTRLQLLPKESGQAARALARRLPDAWQTRLKRLRRR